MTEELTSQEQVPSQQEQKVQRHSEQAKINQVDAISIARWELPKMEVDPEHVIHFETEEQRREKEAIEEDECAKPTEQQINEWKQELKQQIYDEAYAEGHQQGLQAAEQEIAVTQAETKKLQNTLKSIIEHLDSPLEQMNHEVEQQLELLAVHLAQQLVRREIKNDSGQIVGLIRDSIALLPASSRKIKITIHPDDRNVIKDALSLDMDDAELNWKLIDDPMMTAGGCIIKSDQSVINATVENRLASLAASVLSGDREADESSSKENTQRQGAIGDSKRSSSDEPLSNEMSSSVEQSDGVSR